MVMNAIVADYYYLIRITDGPKRKKKKKVLIIKAEIATVKLF